MNKPYAVERAVQDLEALIGDDGGKAAVYGFSSGAVLAVEAAARSFAITRPALLEPPLPSGDGAEDEMAQTAKMIRNGRRGDAVAAFLAGVGLHSRRSRGCDSHRSGRAWRRWPTRFSTTVPSWGTTSYGTNAPGRCLCRRSCCSARGRPRTWGDSARRAADSIPNALSRTLPGAFHDVAPETLAGELGAFLEV